MRAARLHVGSDAATNLQSPHDTTIISGCANAAATQQQPLIASVVVTISTSKS